MQDITLCKNELCPKRKKCYRFMAIPDTIQSYSEFNHIPECEYFEEIDDREIRTLKEL